MKSLRRIGRKCSSLNPSATLYIPSTNILQHNRYLQAKTEKNPLPSTIVPHVQQVDVPKNPNDVESHFSHPSMTIEEEVAAANELGSKIGWEIRPLPCGNGYGVYTTKTFSTNELLIESKVIGDAPQRDKYSLQIDWDRHIYITLPARFLNHCCFPNLKLQNNEHGSYSFYAAKDISIGEELTWDYQTTEFISISVPNAICSYNNKQCRGQSKGFKYLHRELRSLHGDFIADYLKEYKA